MLSTLYTHICSAHAHARLHGNMHSADANRPQAQCSAHLAHTRTWEERALLVFDAPYKGGREERAVTRAWKQRVLIAIMPKTTAESTPT